MKTKICTKCGIEKSSIEFWNAKEKKDGLSIWCKSCTKEAHRKRQLIPNGRICAVCEKPLMGLQQKYCSPECVGKALTNKSQAKAAVTIAYGKKRCSKCKTEKPLTEFAIAKVNSDKRANACKACFKLLNEKHNEIPNGKKCAQCEEPLKGYQKINCSLECSRKATVKERRAKAKETINRGTKICCDCKIEKPLGEFIKDKQQLDGHKRICKECYNEKRIGISNYELRKYGITVEQYEEMHIEQNGLCAICGKPETMIKKKRVVRLSVDHNHKTGETRGLLCQICNFVIGLMKENSCNLRKAADYIEKHNKDDQGIVLLGRQSA